MDSLPTEVLDAICDHISAHPLPSLFPLSLVNKRCRWAALRLIVHRISFHVAHRRRLKYDVERWRALLERNACFPHVRAVHIGGRMHVPEDEDEDEGEEDETLEASNKTAKLTAASFYGTDEVFGPQQDRVLLARCKGLDHPAISPSEDAAWNPLASLLSHFAPNSITALDWSASTQLPPCVLEALHTFQPTCRLSFSNFYFRSLRPANAISVSDEHPVLVSPHERALAMSPCLHSICVFYDALGDYNWEALLLMIARLAPNLKEVLMLPSATTVSTSFMVQGMVEGPSLSLADPTDGSARRKGKLQGLILESNDNDALETWATVTDLSCLKSLHIENMTEEECAFWFEEVGGLTSLQSLGVKLQSFDSKVSDDDEQRVNFLIELPRLRTLVLSGIMSEPYFFAGLEHHGVTLTKLDLPVGFNLQPDGEHGLDAPEWRALAHGLRLEDLRNIRDRCPVLENLQISLKRRFGYSEEVEAYRIIGGMPKLEHLFLLLDCSLAPSEFATRWDAFDSKPCGLLRIRNGDLKDALNNCAFDERLAQDIFHMVDGLKANLEGARRLQSLKLYPYNGGDNIENTRLAYTIDRVVRHISRSWLVERGFGKRSVTTELGQRAREARDLAAPFSLDAAARAVMERMWNMPKDGDFTAYWRSLPLKE